MSKGNGMYFRPYRTRLPDRQTGSYLLQSAPDVGRCRAIVPRWFCNSSSGICQQFTYGGCGGNDNRYDSESMCYSNCADKCQPSSAPVYSRGSSSSSSSRKHGKQLTDSNDQEFLPKKNHMDKTNYNPDCHLPSNKGVCRMVPYPRWFCNSGTGRCQQFLYTGCGGNDNNFEDENNCYNSCGHVCSGGSAITNK
ncbi:thrombin inhibitor hemalin-like [Oppia nitens]|uniref:thrombin inhibitor hemalin-like n=1 Tax=Oppia nitens TaxID=1686743 RepID=UPI0023DCAF35|nr:thrombin inhibitor hemalin-like [Oppia nitens]